MAITIQNLPYDGLSQKINPVYNGLGFVVDSNFKSLNNFKYIAEIFVEGNKVGELRHNPDISNNNYGVFDIGRVVESYVSHDLNWNGLVKTAPNSLKKYYVRFGEEFARVVGIKSYSNSSGKLRLELKTTHPLSTGDAILIQGVTGGFLNSKFINTYTSVIKSGSTGLICNDIDYESGLTITNAYILTGEKVTQWLSWTDSFGNIKVRLKVKTGSSFNVGDKIYMQQPLYNQSYRNIEWTIEKKTTATTYTYLDTSCPFGTAVASTLTGVIVSRDNYVYLNQFSTQNHKSRTFNGVEQYDTWLNWDPKPYMLTTTTGTLYSKKYLTKRPDRELNICLDDWMTLSMFGRTEMSDFNLVAPTRQIVETWQEPAIPLSTTILSSTSATVGTSTNRLRVVVPFDVTTLLNAGDYVDITTGTGTIRARIISRTYSSPNTTITLDTPYDALATYNTFTLVIRAINNTYTFQDTRWDMGVGPKNLNIPEINNGSAYKYFVYSIQTSTTLSNFWEWKRVSETWTFNLKCSCSKFKKWAVVWLNELGGFDYYNFDKRSDKVRKIEREQFRRHLKSYTTSSGYKYTLGDRGRTTYNTQSKDQIVLRTGFLNQEYIDWIQYVFESPEVYIIDLETSKIYPVNCINEDVELINKTNMGDTGSLYIYELSLEMANNRVIQRGGNLAKPATTTTGGGNGGATEPWVNTNSPGVWNQFNYTKSLYE